MTGCRVPGRFFALIAVAGLFALTGCGGDASYGPTPVIKSVTFSPANAAANSLLTLTCLVEFSDSEGDVEDVPITGSLVLSYKGTPYKVTLNIVDFPTFYGKTSGFGIAAVNNVQLDTSTGLVAIPVTLVDSKGHASDPYFALFGQL